MEAIEIKRLLDAAWPRERLSLQMHLDRHATMLTDLLEAGRQRRAKQQELKRSLERNAELPVEAFAHNNDMGPLPVKLERYTALRPQRMSARAVAADSTFNLSDIAILRA